MKLKLFARIILLILVPAVVGLGGLSFVTDRLASDAMKKQIDNDLSQMVRLLAGNIENVVGVLANANATLAQTDNVLDFYEIAATANKEEIDKERIVIAKYLDSVRKNYTRIRDIALLDTTGTIVAHTNPARIGAHLNDVRAVSGALQGNRSTSIQLDKANSVAYALLGSPIHNSKGEIVGVSCVNTDLNVLASTTTDTINVGATGSSFVYDDAGMTIMHPQRKNVGDNLQDTMPWVKEILRAKEGTLAYEWAGVAKEAFFYTSPTMHWTVVIAANEDDLMSAVTELSNTSLILSALVAIFVACTIIFIARQLASALRGCAGIATHVANGNLVLNAQQKHTLEKDGQRSDEIGELAKAIGTMVGNLGDLFKSSDEKTKEAERATATANEASKNAEAAARRAESAKREGMLAAANQLEETLNVIVSASTQLAAQVEQSERGAAAQADRMSETATAMEEMNSTVLEVARNASAASDVSAATRHKAEAGAAVVQQAVRSIQQVQEQSEKLRTDMVQLDENAKSINQIMGVISDIADQTNLLALNAAIEAARAGDAGRGFAVVADEVRKLAEKTMASTTDVGNAIRAIQNSATQSMNQVDASSKKIEEATSLANQSGVNLTEIVSMVDSTADQVRAIATASEQQSASSEEINESIAQVNAIASDNSRSMAEAARAVADLAHQAQILKNLIDNMKASD